MACLVYTDLPAEDFLIVCQEIELALDRVRIEKWGQRTIDLDIVFWNKEMIQEENLIVPHPYAHERGFVLKPLSDIAIDYCHPGLNKTVGEMLRDLGEQNEIRRYVLRDL